MYSYASFGYSDWFVCYLYVFVCYLMYAYVTRMLPLCIRVFLVCYPYVPVWCFSQVPWRVIGFGSRSRTMLTWPPPRPSPTCIESDFERCLGYSGLHDPVTPYSATIYSLEWLESEGEKPPIFCCTGSRVRFEERIHRTWNVLTGILFMTTIRSCILLESTDNRPRDLKRCGSHGMLLVSLLYDRKCLRIDLLKENRCLNAVAIWPVTDQGFQNTKWPAVLYYQ